jgi:hypothetical protein
MLDTLREALVGWAERPGRDRDLRDRGTGALERLAGEAELAIAGHNEDGYDLVLNYEIG